MKSSILHLPEFNNFKNEIQAIENHPIGTDQRNFVSILGENGSVVSFKRWAEILIALQNCSICPAKLLDFFSSELHDLGEVSNHIPQAKTVLQIVDPSCIYLKSKLLKASAHLRKHPEFELTYAQENLPPNFVLHCTIFDILSKIGLHPAPEFRNFLLSGEDQRISIETLNAIRSAHVEISAAKLARPRKEIVKRLGETHASLFKRFPSSNREPGSESSWYQRTAIDIYNIVSDQNKLAPNRLRPSKPFSNTVQIILNVWATHYLQLQQPFETDLVVHQFLLQNAKRVPNGSLRREAYA